MTSLRKFLLATASLGAMSGTALAADTLQSSEGLTFGGPNNLQNFMFSNSGGNKPSQAQANQGSAANVNQFVGTNSGNSSIGQAISGNSAIALGNALGAYSPAGFNYVAPSAQGTAINLNTVSTALVGPSPYLALTQSLQPTGTAATVDSQQVNVMTSGYGVLNPTTGAINPTTPPVTTGASQIGLAAPASGPNTTLSEQSNVFRQNVASIATGAGVVADVLAYQKSGQGTIDQSNVASAGAAPAVPDKPLPPIDPAVLNLSQDSRVIQNAIALATPTSGTPSVGAVNLQGGNAGETSYYNQSVGVTASNGEGSTTPLGSTITVGNAVTALTWKPATPPTQPSVPASSGSSAAGWNAANAGYGNTNVNSVAQGAVVSLNSVSSQPGSVANVNFGGNPADQDPDTNPSPFTQNANLGSGGVGIQSSWSKIQAESFPVNAGLNGTALPAPATNVIVSGTAQGNAGITNANQQAAVQANTVATSGTISGTLSQVASGGDQSLGNVATAQVVGSKLAPGYVSESATIAGLTQGASLGLNSVQAAGGASGPLTTSQDLSAGATTTLNNTAAVAALRGPANLNGLAQTTNFAANTLNVGGTLGTSTLSQNAGGVTSSQSNYAVSYSGLGASSVSGVQTAGVTVNQIVAQ